MQCHDKKFGQDFDHAVTDLPTALMRTTSLCNYYYYGLPSLHGKAWNRKEYSVRYFKQYFMEWSTKF